MQPMKVRGQFLGFAIALGIVASGSILTACSSNTQTQAEAPQPTSTNTGSSQMMDSHHVHSVHMDLGPADADYDLRFIDAMIPHHQGAIAMAKEALQKSQRPEIKTLAQNIIKAQNREENELMRKWRAAWYPQASETPMAYDSQQNKMMPMSAEQKNNMMMQMDLGAADADFDLRFMEAMIPHHEGAIAMAKDALNKAQHPEVKQLANDIIASQQAEIDQMKQWRKAWYGK